MKVILETSDPGLMRTLIDLAYSSGPVIPDSTVLRIIPDENESLRQYRLAPGEYQAEGQGNDDIRRMLGRHV
jgi:hypothetical protein